LKTVEVKRRTSSMMIASSRLVTMTRTFFDT
jgi:hypothetical protein